MLLLVHGLCMNDLQWRRKDHDHGAALAQAAGFTLEQIGELLALDAGEDRARARTLAEERITALDARIA